MSYDLYSVRVYFDKGRGIAKMHNCILCLLSSPIESLESIDYAPEVRTAICRTVFEGWRDMTRNEIAEIDKFLLKILGTS